MITINRSALLSDLYTFCQAGSGLIVGKPGVGKTHILKQLKDSFLDKEILAVMIKIDNLFDASDKSIQDELGVQENWIESIQVA